MERLENMRGIACICQTLLIWLGLATTLWAGEGAVPFHTLAPSWRAEIEEIVRRPSFSRKVTGFRFLSNAAVYEYLLDHPDVATAVARALRRSKYRIEREGLSYRAQDYADFDGTRTRGMNGHFVVVYADTGKRVLFVWGTYTTVLFTIRARAVLVLDYHHRSEDGETYAETDLYSYVHIDHPVLDLVVRLLRPILSKAMDKKIRKTLKLAAEISEAAYRDPAGLLAQLRGSTELKPEAFAQLTNLLCTSQNPVTRGCLSISKGKPLRH